MALKRQYWEFLPFVSTEGLETIGGRHGCIVALWACQERLETPEYCLQATLSWALPITVPGSYL